MACEQFRFLIQQQFDFELPPQDENQLSAHLSQCEACERFHFQIDQIIRTAGDLDLPDDATPENLESLARIVIQQLPKPKAGPFAFFANLFGGKKQPKEPVKPAHTPKNSSRFPHVRRNQSTTNQNASVQSAEDVPPPIEDHSQSISTTLGGRFGRGAHADASTEPEAPLTLADTIRRKVQEERQSLPTHEDYADSHQEAPPEPVWPTANEGIPPIPQPMPPSAPQSQGEPFAQANFQEDNRYAPAGGAWEEPAWSQPPPVPTAPPEPPVPNPLAPIDLMGQTGDSQSNAWSNNAPPPPPMPDLSAPNDLERGLWQAQQDSQQPKAWSDEAEQLETGFWQAFTPEQGSGLSGPAGQLSGQPASAQSAPPPPLPTPLSPPPPPVPMGTLLSPPPTPMAMPPAPPAPLEASQQANQKQEDVVISRFDIPIQERMAMNQAQAPQIQPAAPPPPPVPENLLPKATAESAASEPLVELSSAPKSIISRLSSILGDAPGQAATPQLMSDQNVDLGQPMMAPAADVPMPSPSAQSPAPPPQPQVTQQPAPPPPVPVPAASMQPAAEVQAQPSSGLFNVDERTIDKIFSENLGIVDAGAAVNPGQAPVTNQAVQAAPQAIPVAPPAPQAPIQSAPAAPVPHPASQPPPAPQAPVQKKEPGLFADMDDAAIDQLFSSNLGISEPKATQAQVNAQSIPQPIPAAPPLPPPVPQQAIPQQVVPPPQPAPVAPPPPIQAAVPQPVIPPPVQEIPQPIITTPPAPVEAQPIEIQPAPDFSTQQAPPPPPPPTEIPVAMAPPAPQVPPVQADQSDGILNVTESDLDKLFSENLGVSESALSAAPKVNLTQAVETIRQATGSSQATPPPKIEGVGRLAKNVDTTQDTSSGKISSIGKFLLDQKDLAKLGKVASSSLSSTDMRVLTMEAAQELQNLLGHIGSQPGVAGSVIVGHDGILIANNLPPGHDAESVGVWALGIFLNTENTIKMLGHNHVFQMVARTPQGFLVIADFGGGILVTVSQSSQTNELIPLMRTITQLVAQTAH